MTTFATCANHPGKSAQGTCSQCMRPICSDCLQIVADKPVCTACVAVIRSRIAAEMQSAQPAPPPAGGIQHGAPLADYAWPTVQSSTSPASPSVGLFDLTPPASAGANPQQAYPQPAYPQQGAQAYPQPVYPRQGQQAYPQPAAQGYPQQGGQAYPQPASPAYGQPGPQAYPQPVAQAPSQPPYGNSPAGMAPYGGAPAGSSQGGAYPGGYAAQQQAGYYGQSAGAPQGQPIPVLQQPAAKPNYALGITLGIMASVISAVAWVAIANAIHFEIGYMAIGVGALIGYAVAMGSKAPGTPTGAIAAVLTLLTIGGVEYLTYDDRPENLIFTILFLVIGVRAAYGIGASGRR